MDILTLATIREKFDALIEETESREEIASFAEAAMKAEEDGNLEMERVHSQVIWNSITYLSGVDIQESPGSYLHSKENFIDERVRLGL